MEGRFDSYFKDKPSPLADQEGSGGPQGQALAGGKPGERRRRGDGRNVECAGAKGADHHLGDRSPPESARIILFASNSFLTDAMADLAAAKLGTRYLKPVDLVANAVNLVLGGLRTAFHPWSYPVLTHPRSLWIGTPRCSGSTSTTDWRCSGWWWSG